MQNHARSSENNNKNAGGNTMSLNNRATRRLSLAAGCSHLFAGLVTAVLAGATLTPGQALAANECNPVGVDPTANGTAADTRTCGGATTYQTTGITYTTEGALTVTSTGAMDVGAVGINLVGEQADGVTFSATGTLTGSSGPVLHITSVSGPIIATTTGITLADPAAGVPNSIRLESAGGGAITYTKNGTNAAGTIGNNSEGSTAAIAAITNGGDINLTINTGSPSQFDVLGGVGGVGGRLRGILAQTTGSGAVNLTITGHSGVTAGRVGGIAAVDLVAGSGGATINLAGQLGGRVQSAGDLTPFADSLALRVASSGAVTLNNTDGLVVGGVDFSGVTAGGVVFNNLGTGPTGGAQGGIVLAKGGRWLAAGASFFSSQGDILRMGGSRANTMETGTTIDFGGGVDTFEMSGLLVAKGTVITNLEAFNTSGTIYFGGEPVRNTAAITESDGIADDLLSLPGTTFTGSGASRLVMDVILGGAGQVGCETLTGVADCLDLRGGTTAGSTIITINDASPGAQLSGYQPEGITLVDVSGSGSSAAGHFTLDPASTGGYVHPLYGPAFDRPGGFVYLFRYDAENQRHVLISQPKSRDLFDYAILSGAAHSVWHLTANTVTDRQTGLRDGVGEASVWLRTAGEVTRRDQTTTFEGFDGSFAFDNGYKLYAGTIMGGMDLISGGSEAFDYVLGAQIGYVSSNFDMDESESSGRFTGATGGAYGAVWGDALFLNATVNLNGLALDYQHPSLGSKTTTYVNSIGAAAEAGTRTSLTANTFVEPLAAFSWVRTSFEEISLSAGEVQPADAESLRASLGMRLGATLPGENVSASYFVTGRSWYEFEGESGGVVHNPGADLPFADEFSGAFGEAALGVNIYNAANTLSGVAATGVKWKDGYNAVNLSLAVRMAW